MGAKRGGRDARWKPLTVVGLLMGLTMITGGGGEDGPVRRH